MIAPVTQHGHAVDQFPRQQFLEAVRDIGAGHAELGGDVFGGQRPFGKEQQRLDLRDRAVDAPLRAHVTPAQHELFHRRGRESELSVISVMTEISVIQMMESSLVARPPCRRAQVAKAKNWL
jgi:hypothetical protein